MALNFREFRQAESAECGLICVAIASALMGAEIPPSEMRRRHPVSTRGLTLKEVASIAGSLDMEARALKCEPSELKLLNCPAILHWGMNHYVVLERVSRRKGCKIIDPARGPRWVTPAELDRKFTGVALELAPAPAFKRQPPPSPLKLRALIRWAPSLWGGLGQVLVLSLLLQAYLVISPFYIQLAIDQGAAKGDQDLVFALAIGFALFAIFNAVAMGLRGVASQRMSAAMSWDITRRVFHHMMRLPLPWFQRRRLADAMTRFDAVGPIRDLVSNGLVTIAIDGVLSILLVAMLFVFAPGLALIALIAVTCTLVLRLVSLPASVRYGMAALTASIAEQGKRIETLRAMQTIKVLAAESEREGDWANRFAESVRTRQNAALLDVLVSAIQKLVDTLSLVLIVYLGVSAIMRAEMTVGIFYAFLAYRQQFSTSTQALMDQVVNWRMLDIYTFRLADIVMHPTEAGIDRSAAGMPPIRGSIELLNVGFSYAPHERPILRNVSMKVAPGEFVAIAGPSGAGKSTLLKVLIGLYPTNTGEVRIDGRPMSAWGPNALRRSLGVVMQDDELLSGSVADNVAFFDERIDMDRVWACLKAAAIDEEVAAMPMRADTLIGDMGSAFSGGQKQRLLLARAFYRRPSILLLDEATSHVDLARERAINEALQRLRVTRIVIAHRPETLAAADRIITLSKGSIISDLRRPAEQSRQLAETAMVDGGYQ